MRLFWIAIGTLLAAYAGLALYVYLFQERLVYLRNCLAPGGHHARQRRPGF